MNNFLAFSKWTFLGLVLYVIFMPALRMDNSSLVIAWSFVVYFFAGLSVGGKYSWHKYLLIIFINLLLIIVTFVFNKGLFPLICPLVNIFATVGFFIGNSKLKFSFVQLAGSVFLCLGLFTVLTFKFIPEYSYKQNLVRNSEKNISQALTIENFDGSSLNLKEYKDKIIVLNFTSVNCGFCRLKSNYIEQVKDNFSQNSKVKVLEVYLGENDTMDDVELLLIRFPSSVEMAYDKENKLAKQFEIEGTPSEIIFGRDGNIKRTIVGFNSDMKDEYYNQTIALINSLVVN